MSRLENIYQRHTSPRTKPLNQVIKMDGEFSLVVEETSNPNVGLVYTDFSASSLLKTGSTDLLKQTSRITSNPLHQVDDISNTISNIPVPESDNN